jgi:hypothetical protein
MKNWEQICRSIATPPDSDAEDELNIMSVQKNARKVSDVLHHALPMLDPAKAASLPKGMNSMAPFANPLRRTIESMQVRGGGSPRRRAGGASAGTSSPPPSAPAAAEGRGAGEPPEKEAAELPGSRADE